MFYVNIHYHNLPWNLNMWQTITDRVRSTTRSLCFDTCLSVCPHSQVQEGGTPARSSLGGTLTRGYPDGGWYPDRGTPMGALTGAPMGVPWQGVPWPDRGVPQWGYPNLGGTPMGDTRGGLPPCQTWGVPQQGGTPTGGTLLWLTDGVPDKWRSVCLLRSGGLSCFFCFGFSKVCL